MRPRRLEIEGFTSFKEKLSLDLSSLDLFAITGATGAGKSSLIDALVFALYGQVPRVSKEYRQLISHGAERVTVHLEFEVGERTYRIVRTARASGGPPQTRLESRNGKGWEALADRSREVEEQVRQIVGLDYDAFTRSVVLPQGQFDAFLRGRPEERRKILLALLDPLQIYEQMQTLANRKATEARHEAEFLAKQLATEYADATPERLSALRLELAGAEKEREDLGRQQEALREGLERARRVRESRRDRDTIGADCAAEEERTRAAEATLAKADERRDQLERQREAHERALAAVAFDPDRHALLLQAKPAAAMLGELARRCERVARDCAEKRAALEPKRRALAAADAAVPALEKKAEAARQAREEVLKAREALQRNHAAHELRRRLKAGEPCPVCAQAVKAVPRGAVPALGDADADLRKAEKAEGDASEALRRGQVGSERARGEVEGLERELAQIDGQGEEAARDARTVEEGLREAGFAAKSLRDPAALVASIGAELKGLEAARQKRDEQEKQGRRLETERATLLAAVAAAQAQVESGRKRLVDLKERRSKAETVLETALRELAAAAERFGWTLAGAKGDESDALESRRRDLEGQAGALAEKAAHLKADIRQVETRIARVAELVENKKKREAEGALHATLAQHLRADQFLAFVQEEALRFLAEDGSRHLHRLSQGRYSLACEEQEFAVVDHWNADSRRSVRTLSGGETFLASLSLALALAESLARLSAEGRAGETLESLFLDEGFGTLDAETLDVVVDAIEALQGGERMVGIVTHIPELAERLPARLEVKRGATSATAAVL